MLLKHTKFSEVPQLYVDGKLVGGLELVEEMHSCGELLNILLGDGLREHPDDYDKPKKKEKKKKK